MPKLESHVAECVHIVESGLHTDKRSLHIGIIEGKLLFTDESSLHFIEFVNVKDTTEVYKYSYHYQDRSGGLVFRYDMAPHHHKIKTFPHHKHTPSGRVVEAVCPSLVLVLDEIGDIIDQSSGQSVEI